VVEVNAIFDFFFEIFGVVDHLQVASDDKREDDSCDGEYSVHIT
jgi:hypothetical protein